jgi:hypothetical protein
MAFHVTLVVLGGALAAAGGVTATLLKVAPVTLLPILLAAGRRTVTLAAVLGLGIVGVSWLLSPTAWADYLVVLPNLLAGSADYPTNIAPAATLDRLGLPAPLVDGTRLLTLTLALGFALAAPLIALWRPGVGGWGVGVTLGTASMLLLPAACWYHYLVALLPLAALAWPFAALPARWGLLLGAALITVGVAVLAAATVGAAVLVAVILAVLLRAPAQGVARDGGRAAALVPSGEPVPATPA